MKPITLIGIGGFGKWVITAFKSLMLDIFEKEDNIPNEIKWISFDLTGQEKPEIQVSRFEEGRRKRETLNFSDISKEFFQFGGDFLYEIQKIKDKHPMKNSLIYTFLDEDDASQYIVDANKRGTPAGERRHTSRITFFLSAQKIKSRLASLLMDRSLIFVINSLAGGTGSGTFIDFLILLQNLIKQKNLSCQLINIFLLPKGFVKAKEGEDLNPLKGNCYASFREFQRLDYQKTDIRISYSNDDTDLMNLSKKIDILSNVTYFIDGFQVSGINGDELKYFNGIVPSIVDFINTFAIAYSKEEEDLKKHIKTETSFDQVISHINSNRKIAENNPAKASIYGSFGTYKIIFDIEAIKMEFSQKLAVDVINQFLEDPSLIGSSAESAVQDFLLNEATHFEKQIVYQLKDPKQQWKFASRENLIANLQKSGGSHPKFPEFNFNTIKIEGRIKDLKKLFDSFEEKKLGDQDDIYNPPNKPTFFATLNYYKNLYANQFQDCLRKKVLQILHKDKGTDLYGRGSLYSTLHFLDSLKSWYENFLNHFKEAKLICEQTEVELQEIDTKVENFYNQYRDKGRGFISDPRREYKNLRQLQNHRVLRNLLQDAILNSQETGIAQLNLQYIKKMLQQIRTWIITFEKGIEWTKEAERNLIDTRKEKNKSVCRKYLTNSNDDFEQRLYFLITHKSEIEKLKNYKGTDKKSLIEKEIAQKLPNPSWAMLLDVFSWDFNLKNGQGLPYPDKPEGDLVCLCQAVPDWPPPSQWNDEETILKWNYQLTENFFKKSQLINMKLTACDILMWMGVQPEQVINELEKKSTIMLEYDMNTHNDLGKYRDFNIEKRFVIAGDFQGTGHLLKDWVTDFSNIIQKKGAQVVMGSSHEITIIQSIYNLAAPAITNLINNKDEYLRRLLNNAPPPLHVFRPEKIAFKYENLISNRFKIKHQELHPLITTILENELLIKNFIFGQIFEIISLKETLDKSGNKINFWELEGINLPAMPVEAILQLYFPPDDKAIAYSDAVNKLNKLVGEMRLNKSKLDKDGYKKLLKENLNKMESEISNSNISDLEKDLKRIFIIILEEELKSLN